MSTESGWCAKPHAATETIYFLKANTERGLDNLLCALTGSLDDFDLGGAARVVDRITGLRATGTLWRQGWSW